MCFFAEIHVGPIPPHFLGFVPSELEPVLLLIDLMKCLKCNLSDK